MNHSSILKRSWQILWSYRVLWVFGFLLAFTTASSSGNPSSGARVNQNTEQQAMPSQPGDEGGLFQEEIDDLIEVIKPIFKQEMTPELQRNLIIAGIVVGLVVLVLTVVFTIIRYTSEVALIKMVDDYEGSGEKLGLRQGFRLGWSRAAWRLFLIDLILLFPLVIVIGGLMAAAVVIVMTGAAAGKATGIVAMVAGIGLVFLLVFVAMLVAAVLTVLLRYIYRCCVLEDLGVFDSIRQGYGLARRHLKDTGIMALIMLGINIGYPIVLFPVSMLLLAISVLFGGGSALAVGGLTGLFSSDPSLASLLSAVTVGSMIFIVFMAIPLNFLRGLKITYQSSAWTLAYRELRALEALEINTD